MGLNLDLTHMLGVQNNKQQCPECGHPNRSYFDDYDVECGPDPNPEPGVWVLQCGCIKCDHTWAVRVKLSHEIITDG